MPRLLHPVLETVSAGNKRYNPSLTAVKQLGEPSLESTPNPQLSHLKPAFNALLGGRGGDSSGAELLAFNETRLKCLLKCVFSLSEEEAQVLTYLIRRGSKAIVKDIASELGRNPEVVRRALRRLHAKSLVTRRPYPLRKGGRAYVYEVPSEVVKLVSSLCEHARSAIEVILSSHSGNGEER